MSRERAGRKGEEPIEAQSFRAPDQSLDDWLAACEGLLGEFADQVGAQ